MNTCQGEHLLSTSSQSQSFSILERRDKSVGEAGEVESGTKTTAYTHTTRFKTSTQHTLDRCRALCTGYMGQRRASVRRKKELCWEQQRERGWEGGRGDGSRRVQMRMRGVVCTPHPPPRLSEQDGDGGFLIAKRLFDGTSSPPHPQHESNVARASHATVSCVAGRRSVCSKRLPAKCG